MGELNYPSFSAGGTIPPRRVVIHSTTADNTVLASGANGAGIGISKRSMKRPPGLPGSDTDIAAEAGEGVEVITHGVALAEAGGAITRGSLLESDANGRVVAYTAGAGRNIIGWALESASGSGVEIRIYVSPMRGVTVA